MISASVQGAIIQLKNPPDQPVGLPGPMPDKTERDVETAGGQPAKPVKEHAKKRIWVHTVQPLRSEEYKGEDGRLASGS